MYAPDEQPTVSQVWAHPRSGGVIFVGGEGAVTAEFLASNRVGAVLTVNDEPSLIFTAVQQAHGVEHEVLPFLDDHGVRQSAEHGRNAGQAVESLARRVDAGQRVVVHCRMGQYRSATVTYLALVSLGAFPNAYEAYLAVRKRRREVQYRHSLIKWVRRQAEARG